MNSWSLAIGNLQHRSASVEAAIVVHLTPCNNCGAEKPASEFREVMTRSGKIYRRKVCRACENAKDREYRAKYAPPKPPTSEEKILGALASGPMIISEISITVSLHRAGVKRAIDKLIIDGLVSPQGYAITKYHPRVTKYGLVLGLTTRP